MKPEDIHRGAWVPRSYQMDSPAHILARLADLKHRAVWEAMNNASFVAETCNLAWEAHLWLDEEEKRLSKLSEEKVE